MKRLLIAVVTVLLLTGCVNHNNQCNEQTYNCDEVYLMPPVPTPLQLPLTNDVEIEVEEVIEEKEPYFYLSDYERQVVEYIVTGESIGEPYEGQVAVAQCILNAALKDGIQPSEVRTKYKYSGWNTNPTDSVKQAVSAVFDDGYTVTDEKIMYFYAPKYSKGRFHNTQKFIMEIGGHRFFAEWED